ncbi:MAG: 3-keto-5-aminohexanoate cleavage protein [Desulfosalsimonadaceae bacterium]
MKANLATSDKVIITAAITGGIHGKWANEAIPITAEEQARDALDCYNAGAAVLHLHVRGADGQNTPDIGTYNQSVRMIGEACPIIRQIGNGIGARVDEALNIIQPTLEERLALLTIEPKPEMHTINAGTFEFRTPYGSGTFNNPLSFNEQYAGQCKNMGFAVEIEVYDLSHIANALELVEKGVLTPPLHFSIVLGIMGGAPATAANLICMLDAIPEGSSWQVVTIGKYHVPTTVMAMAMGGNVRTGLEDTVYYQKGEKAKGNAQLVERMVRIAREIGREPATVGEARTMLGIPG